MCDPSVVKVLYLYPARLASIQHSMHSSVWGAILARYRLKSSRCVVRDASEAIPIHNLQASAAAVQSEATRQSSQSFGWSAAFTGEPQAGRDRRQASFRGIKRFRERDAEADVTGSLGAARAHRSHTCVGCTTEADVIMRVVIIHTSPWQKGSGRTHPMLTQASVP